MEVHITAYVGERIRTIRKNRNYTQEQLGEKVGLPQPYIGAIERGERNISLDTLERILEALDSAPNDFFQYYKDNYLSEDERARESALDGLNDLLVNRSAQEIRMIQQIVHHVLVTLDSHIEKNNL
ncbi:helix-turn-helix transcriptional regulator [Paenibacillus sp. M-152]|uniref:helix-turn-helix domain-containing protein n=1 Tax=Paenibacillus sp. M-152 TaxID=2487928 RepID=UPI0013EC1297|nr:helix-turn-helix transcriptional regulator [Paenibacillus sp. M-152]